jgi:3-oxoacyl-[acyl-carrier protein] reductase
MDGVALITGASRGIGRAVAIELGKRGYRLALVARSLAELKETGRLAGAEGAGETMVLAGDVTDAGQVEELVRRAEERWGRLDAVVNVAGIAPRRTIEEMSVAEWREVIETNLSAVFYVTKFAWPILRETAERFGRAAVVNVSSMASRDPFAGFAAYGAAKAGLNVFDLVAAREGGACGIDVHTIAPGAVETGMFRALMSAEQFPRERTLSPVEVAEVIVQCVVGALRHTRGEVIYLHKTV